MLPISPKSKLPKSDLASTPEEIQQAVRENSILRGLFFLKNLSMMDVDAILKEISKDAHRFDMEEWRDRSDSLGVSVEALDTLDNMNPPIPYPYYFCTPEQIIEKPQLLAYYRNVAMISNKVMNGIGLDTGRYEAGREIEKELAEKIILHLNQVVSSLVSHTELMSPNRHIEMVSANLGASIDGSWRNEVGRLAYITVLNPLILHLKSRAKVRSVQYRLKGYVTESTQYGRTEDEENLADKSYDEVASFLKNLEDRRPTYTQLNMNNGNTILLNRQLKWDVPESNLVKRIGPDLITGTAPDPIIRYVWAAELKGGADPAGSDEHWKTATQAFNRIIEAARETGRKTPKLSFLATILVDRVAQEAELWIKNGKLTSVHNLTKIANDSKLQTEFLNQLAEFFESTEF